MDLDFTVLTTKYKSLQKKKFRKYIVLCLTVRPSYYVTNMLLGSGVVSSLTVPQVKALI